MNWAVKTDAKLIAGKLAYLAKLRKTFETAKDVVNIGMVERSMAGLAALPFIEEKALEAVSAREWAQAVVAYRELDDKEKVLHAAIGAFRYDMSPAARHVVKDALTCLGKYEEAYQVISQALLTCRGGDSNSRQVLRAYAGAYTMLCAYTQRWDLFKSACESDDSGPKSSFLNPSQAWCGEITDALALVGPVVRRGRRKVISLCSRGGRSFSTASHATSTWLLPRKTRTPLRRCSNS